MLAPAAENAAQIFADQLSTYSKPPTDYYAPRASTALTGVFDFSAVRNVWEMRAHIGLSEQRRRDLVLAGPNVKIKKLPLVTLTAEAGPAARPLQSHQGSLLSSPKGRAVTP